MLDIKIIPFNSFQENCVILSTEGKKCVIVDPGFSTLEEKDRLYGFLKSSGLEPEAVILTHGHFDHIYGVRTCAGDFNLPVYMNPADMVILENNSWFCEQYGLGTPEPFKTADIAEGDRIMVSTGRCINAGTAAGDGKEEDGEYLEVIETPGHTPGGVSLLCRTSKVLLSGDTLFAGSIGRTDNQWGDYDALMKSILTKLIVLDGDIDIIPGHGPATDVAYERQNNPFLMPFNEPLEDEL